MLKRLILVAVFSCMFVVAVPTASATSNGGGDGGPADFDFNGKTASDNIWIGLCTGASLEISQVSQNSCEHQLKHRPVEDSGPAMTCTQDDN